MRRHSLTDLDMSAQPKSPGIDGRNSLVSKKSLIITPAKPPSAQIHTPKPANNDKRMKGKYSRLKRELSLALQTGGDTICMVTVDDQYREQDVCVHGGFMSTLETSAIAQTAAVSDIPRTIAEAMHCYTR